MIVPEYWAEARIQKRVNERQITVRRYGWSDVCLEEAQANADERAQDAFARIAAGEKLERREPKVAYNGADGVPIREEIVGRHGDAIITRNIYGARCLNTPNVFFADVDFTEGPSAHLTCVVYLALMIGAIVFGVMQRSALAGISAAVLGLIFGYAITGILCRTYEWIQGGAEKRAYRRVARFAASRPDWHLRLYRTPAGFRVLVMHRTFDPADPEVQACFDALGTDPVYARMCLNQRCFRARASPKPWRIGITQHLRPRPGVWPVKAERLPERRRWIEAYEAKAREYASCRFVEAFGRAEMHPAAYEVQVIHDELCRANTQMPIA